MKKFKYLLPILAVVIAITAAFAFNNKNENLPTQKDVCDNLVWFKVSAAICVSKFDAPSRIDYTVSPVVGNQAAAITAFACPESDECVCGIGYLVEDIDQQTGRPFTNATPKCYVYRPDTP